MRVLQVASSLYDWGGVERYIVYLAQGLAHRGHEVAAIVPLGSPLDLRLSCRKHHLALRAQFGFHLLPGFVRAIRRFAPEVAHIHFAPDFVVPAIAARMAKTPLVVMTRHLVLPWSASKARRYTKLFDHIIAVSEAARLVLVESGVPRSHVEVAKAGCPAVPVRQPPANPFRAAFFGRLVKEKGAHILVEAARVAADVQFDVYGDGPERASLMQGSPGNVRYHGAVPDVAGPMGGSSCVVVPSIWAEAFPFAVLEAMSAGRCVVASKAGGLPEMVQEGVTGLLVPPGDPQALADVLSRLAQEPATVAEMGRRASDVHAEEFTIERMAERIEAVYLGCLARDGTNAGKRTL